MLLSAAIELKRQGKEHRNLKLYGQELNLMSSSIARMNLFLHGIVDFHIERGNTLSEPKFLEADRLMQFDVVLANPPYSIKQWDRQLWAADPYGRSGYGVPPQGRADYAFFQHILASMKRGTGRCAILFPHGVLFRDDEREMRKRMVDADVIDCVLGLGPGLFYNSPMEACVVFCRTDRPAEHSGKVLFINAVSELVRERGDAFLSAHHIARIARAYANWCDDEAFAKVVPLDDILSRDGDMGIQWYVPAAGARADAQASASARLRQAVEGWQAASHGARAAVDAMRARVHHGE
jgi:type I restriction enzyme M protein